MTHRADIRGTTLRTALWTLLGGWLGAWALFAFAVAPVAFRVLPNTEIAGRLVAPLLTSLHLYGAGCGVVLAGLALALDRPAWLAVLPLLLSAICLYSHFGVSAEMAEIRELAFGPGGSAELAARFNRLHGLSMTLFGVTGAGAFALIALHARAEAPGGRT